MRVTPQTSDEHLQCFIPDPVMGLAEVARGHTVMTPTTVYLLKNNDRSGMVGILFPGGQFVSKISSTTGKIGECIDEWNDVYDTEVTWDGAQKQPLSKHAIGWWDEEEQRPIYQEHSKGILLGEYPNNGELWKALKAGRRMR